MHLKSTALGGRRIFLCHSALAVASMMTIGCAPFVKDADGFQIKFKAPALEDELKQANLLDALILYWQYYVDQAWSKRYALENFQGLDLKVNAYEAYHLNASKLRGVEVLSIHKDGGGRIRLQIHVEFESKESPQKTAVFLMSDWWEKDSNGQWLHLNHDPILRKGLMKP